MNIQLSALEARIIGCLIEKAITTPDQYPLSLNALTLACNQKSNRDPVLNLGDADVQQVVDGLSRRHMVMERSGFGSRVSKYQHLFCNTEYGSLKFSPQELAVICELLLRGPQTPGELRARASRMATFADAAEIESTLEALRTRADGPFVVRLPRESGRRESRYAHRFGEHAASEDAAAIAVPARPAEPATHIAATNTAVPLAERVRQLEERVAALEAALSRAS